MAIWKLVVKEPNKRTTTFCTSVELQSASLKSREHQDTRMATERPTLNIAFIWRCLPEARFVRFVDKLLPAIINAVASDANTFKEDYGINSVEELNASREARTAKLQAMFPLNGTKGVRQPGGRRYGHRPAHQPNGSRRSSDFI